MTKTSTTSSDSTSSGSTSSGSTNSHQAKTVEAERLQRQDQRNYAILALLLGWVALVVLITMVKVGQGL